MAKAKDEPQGNQPQGNRHDTVNATDQSKPGGNPPQQVPAKPAEPGEASAATPKTQTTDAGAAPGRYDSMQASGADAPLKSNQNTPADPMAPGTRTGGTRQGGPLSGDPAAAIEDPDARRERELKGLSFGDVIATGRAFIAAVRGRDVSGAATNLGKLLQAFGELFDGGDPNVFGTTNPAEYDRLCSDLDTLRGEAGSFAAEFRNPSYHRQGGATSGAAPGMAPVPATAGIDPGTILSFIELAKMIFDFFRKRNGG